MTRNTPFRDVQFRTYIQNREKGIKNDVQQKGDSLLHLNARNFAHSLAEKYKIKPLKINFDKVEKKIISKKLKGSEFPVRYDVSKNQEYEIDIAQYAIPYTAETALEKVYMQYQLMNVYEFYISPNGYLIIEFINYGKLVNNDVALQKIKRDYNQVVDVLKEIEEGLNKAIEIYNTNLENRIKDEIDKHVSELQARKDSENML